MTVLLSVGECVRGVPTRPPRGSGTAPLGACQMPRGADRIAPMPADLPRATLAPLPTPLQHLPRFSAAVGAEVWMKRDDVGALCLAGNKVRKLEFVLGGARHRSEERRVG